MKLQTLGLLGLFFFPRDDVSAFSCAPPEYRGLSPCEIPKCCESGELTTEVCSGCPKCTQAIGQDCGAGFEAYQPFCGSKLACFYRCPKCKTVVPPELELAPGDTGLECVFPFIHKGKTYNNCTTDDFPNDPAVLQIIMPWCAVNIEPGAEIPVTDNWWAHRAECQAGCPGTDFECGEYDLINHRGTCVDEKEQFTRIARPYAYEFNPGVNRNDTKTIQKCSSSHTPYENERIKQGKCYCLPPREASPHLADLGFSGGKQEGEGCTKAPDVFIALDSGGLAPPPQPLTGWCYLAGVKDPRWNEPEEYCYEDMQWSEPDQKYWSSDACKDVPITGLAVPSIPTIPGVIDVE